MIGIDISRAAVACARENAAKNGIKNCKFLVSDFFSDISGKFNYILFNPPYLPTKKSERLKNKDENAAYDGGNGGLSVFLRFCKEAYEHLAPKGKVAVIATSLNNGIEKVQKELSAHIGETRIVSEEKFFFEKIALIEAGKSV